LGDLHIHLTAFRGLEPRKTQVTARLKTIHLLALEYDHKLVNVPFVAIPEITLGLRMCGVHDSFSRFQVRHAIFCGEEFIHGNPHRWRQHEPFISPYKVVVAEVVTDGIPCVSIQYGEDVLSFPATKVPMLLYTLCVHYILTQKDPSFLLEMLTIAMDYTE
jgi:hypothetical protein